MFWTLTFHILGYSVSIRIQKLKSKNRHPARGRFLRADIAQNKLSTKRGQPPVAASPFHLLLYPIPAICQAPQNNPNPFTFCKTMHTSAKRAQIVNKCPPCALSCLKVFPFFPSVFVLQRTYTPVKYRISHTKRVFSCFTHPRMPNQNSHKSSENVLFFMEIATFRKM